MLESCESVSQQELTQSPRPPETCLLPESSLARKPLLLLERARDPVAGYFMFGKD